MKKREAADRVFLFSVVCCARFFRTRWLPAYEFNELCSLVSGKIASSPGRLVLESSRACACKGKIPARGADNNYVYRLRRVLYIYIWWLGMIHVLGASSGQVTER